MSIICFCNIKSFVISSLPSSLHSLHSPLNPVVQLYDQIWQDRGTKLISAPFVCLLACFTATCNKQNCEAGRISFTCLS